MSDDGAKVVDVRITYRLDATVTINGNSWVKPGVEASIKFDGLPSSDQLQTGSQYLISEIVEPLLGQVMESVLEQTAKAEGLTKG